MAGRSRCRLLSAEALNVKYESTLAVYGPEESDSDPIWVCRAVSAIAAWEYIPPSGLLELIIGNSGHRCRCQEWQLGDGLLHPALMYFGESWPA